MILLSSISKVIQAFSGLLQVDIACFDKEGRLIAATEDYITQKGMKVHVPFLIKYTETTSLYFISQEI
ncbi:hypothetical protein OR571_16950 [Psychrobacillus sp. NEAU-3TGS]|uniref:hypothetical protein n=1 Tax=Psychrobacillus sp. NEAU-3TGS TaxID=2995412 RepID=UPI0024972AC4|nr:hypothetical protein [Psychrobacillus sp. NEAU-3TGS]MDI2588743.1 hypothetical protein [Psychrobacillus sp. NEAU-3TGS]